MTARDSAKITMSSFVTRQEQNSQANQENCGPSFAEQLAAVVIQRCSPLRRPSVGKVVGHAR